MEEQVENWVKVGTKWEHNLPDGTHVIYGREFTTPITPADCEYLDKKGSKHVRKFVAPKTSTKTPTEG